MSDQGNAASASEEPDELADQAARQAPPATTADEPERVDGVREDMVQRLLKGFRESQGNAAIGDFIGAEFSHDAPTDAERAEAHRRYVDELAEKGMSELGEPER